jgi:uncharacterized membrane protein required for colicin V production
MAWLVDGNITDAADFKQGPAETSRIQWHESGSVLGTMKLPVNWFDFAVVLMLFVGLLRGRKRGMSEEFLTCTKWVVLIVLCALAYEPLGTFVSGMTPFSKLFCYIVCYLAVAGLVAGGFILLKNSLGGKLIGSDTFGGSEYYLGMPAGMLRFACIVMVFLALLNARQYRTSEVIAMKKFQNDNYGSEFFPTLQTLQSQVFEQSLMGPPIKKYLSFFLIKPTLPEAKNIARAKENLP